MKAGHGLLGAAVALFLVVVSVRAGGVGAQNAPGAAAPQTVSPATPSSTPTHYPAVPAGTTSADYIGSNNCGSCHKDAYQQWRQSLHIRMTKPIAEATVVGDFSGAATLDDHGRAFAFGTADGTPFMRIAFGTAKPETFRVDYTLGAKRYQGYLSTMADGRIYVLPAFWHIESRRWVDWKEITPIPEGAHDLRQIWNTNCFNCHGTNIAQGFDVAAKRYKSTWTEMGIGCEACHGPGKPHVELMEAWEKNPESKPAYDTSAKNRELSGLLKIFSPRTATPRQTYDTCAYCHGNKQNVFLGFRAGDHYDDYALPFLISEPLPENDYQGEFWPDGRPNRFNRPQALTMSGCFKAGQAVCTSCHLSHGSRNPFSLKVNITQGRSGDLLCVQCHSGASGASSASGARLLPVSQGVRDPIAPWSNEAIEQHTFHKADSAGSRCISCHMSDVNWRLLIRRRDHTFQAPVPETTAAFGVPNACTTCHDDRTPEWAARQMDQWWGDGSRRQASTSLADTMYRAGSGDARALPGLARLAVDRSQGLLVRASAVEFMQQLALGTAGTGNSDAQSQTSFGRGAAGGGKRQRMPPAALTPEQVNALIGAASDPEPIVRAQAVNALLAAGTRDRIVPPIVARLNDSSRIVRARAAEALLALGISSLPGAIGQQLARAQDEYAQSLQDFPDAATNHSALGWLDAERNRTAEASAALDRAMSLDPRAARPLVIKGVIAARENRFNDAIDLWKKAKAVEPAYPNIDQLIAEAEKRRKLGPGIRDQGPGTRD